MMKSRLVYFLTLPPVNKIITLNHNCALSNSYRILCARLDHDGTSIVFSPTSPCNKHLEFWSFYVHSKGSILPHVLQKITSKVWVPQKFPYMTPLLNTTIQLCDFTSVITEEGSSQDIVSTTWVILTHP